METIGRKIKELRKKRAVTQAELGRARSVSEQVISQWACGSAYPDIMTLCVLASLFGVGIDDMHMPATAMIYFVKNCNFWDSPLLFMLRYKT